MNASGDIKKFYEVVLDSSKQKLTIKSQTYTKKTASYKGHSIWSHRTVTVTWFTTENGGTVEVSAGSVPGENVLMRWRDKNPIDVNYIAVKTVKCEGEWEVEKEP